MMMPEHLRPCRHCFSYLAVHAGSSCCFKGVAMAKRGDGSGMRGKKNARPALCGGRVVLPHQDELTSSPAGRLFSKLTLE